MLKTLDLFMERSMFFACFASTLLAMSSSINFSYLKYSESFHLSYIMSGNKGISSRKCTRETWNGEPLPMHFPRKCHFGWNLSLLSSQDVKSKLHGDFLCVLCVISD